MKQQTFVLFKDPRTNENVPFDASRWMQPGEALTDVVLQQPVYPPTNPQLTVTIAPDFSMLTLAGGMNGVSYGAPLQLTFSSGRTLIVLLAVSVAEATLFPQAPQNPGEFADLVDSIEAGHAANGVAVFVFDPTFDPSGGFVEWRLLDVNGTTQAAGTAYEYRINATGVSNIVRASCVINIPSSIPPTSFDCKYQIQYVLYLNGVQSQTVAENITIIGLTTTPLGASDAVELQGTTAALDLVTDYLPQNVQVSLSIDNTLVGAPLTVYDYQRVDSGYLWRVPLDTSGLNISLEPYVILWQYWNPGEAKTTEYAKLHVVNPSILDAINDVQARVNKARTNLYGLPDLLFPPETIMIWLRRGRDYFNGATGQFTSFTMLNAKNIIREYWLQSAEMFALESQELAEAEKAFDYQGANISLNVDRTSAYQQAADQIRQRLDQDLKPVKTNLIIKGNTQGDGSADPSTLQRGAIGSVGITVSPASIWGRFPSGLPRSAAF